MPQSRIPVRLIVVGCYEVRASEEKDEKVSERNGLQVIPSFEEELQRYYEANGAGFGSVDVLCCGSTGVWSRIGALLKTLAHDIPRCTIVVPPHAVDGELTEERIKLAVQAAPDRTAPSAETETSSNTEPHFRLVQSPDLRTQSVLQIFDEAEPESFVVVPEAAEYRMAGVLPYTVAEEFSPALAEDWWVPHLHAFATETMRRVRGRRVFVVLDAGKSSPLRPELRSLLQSIDHCGVLATTTVDDPEAIIAAHTANWNEMLANGLLGPVLKDISELPPALDREKAFLRILMLDRAGLSSRALYSIEHELPMTEHPNSAAVVKLARIAEDAGASATAVRLLDTVIESITSHESLLLALATALDTGDDGVEDRVAKRLAAFFPDSPVLRRREAESLAFSRRYREAADALGDDPSHEVQSSLFKGVAEFLGTPGAPDYLPGLDALAKQRPDLAAPALELCIQDALNRRLLVHALTLATSDTHSGPTKPVAKLLLRVLEQIFINRDPAGNLAVDTDDLQPAAGRLVRYLSENPADGEIRVGLVKLLAVDLSGSTGISLIASTTLSLLQVGVEVSERERVTPYSLEELQARAPFLKSCFSWLSDHAPLVLGRLALPKDLITEPPDKVVPAIMHLASMIGQNLNDDSDVDNLTKWVTLGIALTPHTANPDDDIALIKVAAGQLATAGRVQLARDWAEQILQHSQATSHRRRLAWSAMSDIYQRAGNPLESVIALACAAASQAAPDAQQIYFETTALVRLLRDLGLLELSQNALETAREVVARLQLSEQFDLRLDTLGLQLDMLDFLSSDELSATALTRLVEATCKNGKAVLLSSDEPGPVAAILGQLLRVAGEIGVPVQAEANDMLAQLLSSAGSTTAPLVNLASAPHFEASDVLAYVKRMEEARYSEDVGFDVGNVVLLARRLLAGEAARSDPYVAAFAIEMLADRAVAIPGWESVASPPPAPKTIEAPGSFAKELSRASNVVMAGIDADLHLVTVTSTADDLRTMVEDKSTFSVERLQTWKEEYPYRYGVDDTTFNLFYTSTDGIGLSGLPEGRVLVQSATPIAKSPSAPTPVREGKGLPWSLRMVVARR